MRHVKAGLSHRGTRETGNPLNMHIQYLLTPAPTTQREWFQGFRVSFSTLCGWKLMQQAPWPPVPRNRDAVQPRPVLMQPQPGQQSTHSNSNNKPRQERELEKSLNTTAHDALRH